MKGHRLALIFILLVTVVFGARLLLRPQARHHALQARAVATRVLGHYLATNHAAQRVVVMSNPFIRRPDTDRAIIETEEAGLRGLREGIDRKLTLAAVVYPELRPEARENPRAVPIDAETTTPLSYLVAPDAFDVAVRQASGCDIVVSLIGLPIELSRCEAWQTPGAPSFALLLPDLRMVGGPAQIEAVLRSGKLLAFVMRKPGGLADNARLEKEPDAEFDRRFLLVTRDNFSQLQQAFPELF